MSVVWRAHDELLDREVAVKILDESGDERFRMRLRMEAKASSQLTHPRIARIYDYGEAITDESSPAPYLVMELINGRPLSDHLADGATLPWWEAALAGAEIAEALAAAHEHGLVHRDIKPDNVIVTDEGMKLIDFGISAVVGSPEADADGQLLGTAAYVAPERLADVPVGAPADVYALGVLLYRMLTGSLPWRTDSNTGLLRAHLFAEPAPLPAIAGRPDRLDRLCRACLAKQPFDRPSGASLAGQLRTIAAEHVDAPAPRAADTTPRPPAVSARGGHAQADTYPIRDGASRRRPGRLVLAATTAAAATALLSAAWSGGTHAVAEVLPPSCVAAYSIVGQTATEFAASLTVTNTGPADIPAWRISFAFPAAQHIGATTPVRLAGQPRAAAVHQTGATVVATGTGQPRILRRDASVALAIHGRYSGADPPPATVRLNDQTCQNEAITPTVTTHPTPPGRTPTAAATPARGSAPVPAVGPPRAHGGNGTPGGNGHAGGTGHGHGKPKKSK